jgi:hypothetical protein
MTIMKHKKSVEVGFRFKSSLLIDRISIDCARLLALKITF